jgi:hypothetical protein
MAYVQSCISAGNLLSPLARPMARFDLLGNPGGVSVPRLFSAPSSHARPLPAFLHAGERAQTGHRARRVTARKLPLVCSQVVLLSLLAGLLMASLLAPSSAAAQVGGSRMHIGAGIALDFGGEVDFERPSLAGTNAGGDDLEATFGVRGHLDYQLHKYLSVGGMVRMSWWEPDFVYAIDRSFLLDLGPRLIGHYDWRDFRFYGGISPGLTISAINDDDDRVGVDNPAAGFTLSLTIAGMEWWFSRRVGLFVELGWVGHWFEHDGQGNAADLGIDLSQGLFEFGFVFGV